jgi:holliday junction DNA helicase RuvA
MIGRLTGKVIQDEDDFVLVVDVAGVGYDVHAPLGTAGRAKKTGDAITLFVHTHVREDALLLYGFANSEDRAAFRALLSVANIGPKSAISILSVLPAGELAAAIAAQEVKTLTSISGVGKKTAERILLAISGVGKKTAERILLELEGKIAPSLGGTKTAARPQQPKGPALEGQALALHGALVNLGYKPVEAERAVTTLGDIEAETDLSSLLRRALASLTK